jgi:hypothetical protein
MPQKLGHDVDLETLPLVAFTSRVCRKLSKSLKYWIYIQSVMFPVVTTLLVALGWQFYLHPRHIMRTKNIGEGVTLILRYVLWSLFITPHFGLSVSVALYLAYTW